MLSHYAVVLPALNRLSRLRVRQICLRIPQVVQALREAQLRLEQSGYGIEILNAAAADDSDFCQQPERAELIAQVICQGLLRRFQFWLQTSPLNQPLHSMKPVFISESESDSDEVSFHLRIEMTPLVTASYSGGLIVSLFELDPGLNFLNEQFSQQISAAV